MLGGKLQANRLHSSKRSSMQYYCLDLIFIKHFHLSYVLNI
jgi:hypothetical protein